ncbi:unnamed protein product [Allacma fusca]|uniref:E3 ubiquitin-protein ligase RNF25 n=1 Tax=Allacma fusca TaxID=39272 RepID=A0A8J2JM98_9HEXA|nr:unnamed protein product [Allacma fusca]
MPSDACAEELESVLAIFLDDIQVVHHDSDHVLVSMILFPSTGDDTESKYVTLTLELLLPPEYPEKRPKITFRNPRGLSEEMLHTLINNMNQKCEEIMGCSMIFELIDMGREFLTRNNRPASECPICLLSFTEFDVFFRPTCFHHVHSFCLGKYLYSVSQSLSSEDHLPNESLGKHCCPVCRNEFTEDIDIQKFLAAPPPSEENQEALLKPCVPEDWLGKRESLNRLFAKQKSQGGIIDLTEKEKKLLVISSPPRSDTAVNSGSQEESTSTQLTNSADNSSTRSVPPVKFQPRWLRSQYRMTVIIFKGWLPGIEIEWKQSFTA